MGPEFYGDLVYKLKKNVRVDFSGHFRKITIRYKRVGYNINVMGQSACLLGNPITINSYPLSLQAGWSCIRVYDCPNIKLVMLVGWGLT